MQTELEVAQGIRDGTVSSPFRYENVWLFDLRITGTGIAYRSKHDEYAARDPAIFLTEEFVARCNGLPVVFEHPEKTPTLTAEDYQQRAIGTIMLPYIKGDEVRGVAKIFDDDAAKLMTTTHTSTSPGVVFRNPESTERQEIAGETVMIEGKPSYVDHLAICEVGVWDKGGEPSGVGRNDSVPETTNPEEPPVAARKDEAMSADDKAPPGTPPADSPMDAVMKRLDAVCGRLDAMEKKGGDTGELPNPDMPNDSSKEEAEASVPPAEFKGDSAEEAAKKDADEEAAKKDADDKDKEARKDSMDLVALKDEIARLKDQMAGISRENTASERDEIAAAFARADAIYQMFGERASPALAGERPLAYRKRLAAKLQRHSEKFGKFRLDSVSDAATYDLVEREIYADAERAARSPDHAPEHSLIPITRNDNGHTITHFRGDPLAWMAPFQPPMKTIVTKFDKHAGRRS